MIYKEVFDLQGTEQQQQIVIEALDAIKFPFERALLSLFCSHLLRR